MMRYRLTMSLNDGKRDAPPHEIDVPEHDLDELADRVVEACCNDYDEPFGVGFSLLVERTA
jgi:hypothetical protein